VQNKSYFFPLFFDFAPPRFVAFGLAVTADGVGTDSLATTFGFGGAWAGFIGLLWRKPIRADPNAPVMIYSAHLGRSTMVL
jgi:hypothetical protein